MSYDTSLVINTGIEQHEVVDCGNYTYNVGGMFHDALKQSYSSLHGMSAQEATPILYEAIKKMSFNPDNYKEMEPLNGWGNYEGAMAYLTTLYNACLAHPACTINIS